jgi:hypothetical protein
LEEYEELRNVLEELRTQDPVSHMVERPGRHIGKAAPVRDGEEAQQPGTEKLGHTLGSQEKVDGVTGRRRVDDDQVVSTL